MWFKAEESVEVGQVHTPREGARCWHGHGVFFLCESWAFPLPKDQRLAWHRDVPSCQMQSLQSMQSPGPGCFLHSLPACFLWMPQ